MTFEISFTKWPADSDLPTYWDDNRDALLEFILSPFFFSLSLLFFGAKDGGGTTSNSRYAQTILDEAEISPKFCFVNRDNRK